VITKPDLDFLTVVFGVRKSFLNKFRPGVRSEETLEVDAGSVVSVIGLLRIGVVNGVAVVLLL
jgi:hypothetical protein